MADHPSTFRGGTSPSGGIEWEDRASIRLRNEGDGLIAGLTGLHRGSLAEMVRMFAAMSRDQQDQMVIQKAGDRTLDAQEVRELADHPDLPQARDTE